VVRVDLFYATIFQVWCNVIFYLLFVYLYVLMRIEKQGTRNLKPNFREAFEQLELH
jgi:hypothetical protein